MHLICVLQVFAHKYRFYIRLFHLNVYGFMSQRSLLRKPIHPYALADAAVCIFVSSQVPDWQDKNNVNQRFSISSWESPVACAISDASIPSFFKLAAVFMRSSCMPSSRPISRPC